MQFWTKIWYVSRVYISDNLTTLPILSAPPGNQKSRLLFDRTHHFNNTWEGEYLIKNYPAMRLWQKFGMLEGVHLWQSDNSANSYDHLETRIPGCYLTEPNILTTAGKENTW